MYKSHSPSLKGILSLPPIELSQTRHYQVLTVDIQNVLTKQKKNVETFFHNFFDNGEKREKRFSVSFEFCYFVAG